MEKVENKQVVNKKEIVKKLLKQEISVDDESDLIEMLIDRPITIVLAISICLISVLSSICFYKKIK